MYSGMTGQLIWSPNAASFLKLYLEVTDGYPKKFAEEVLGLEDDDSVAIQWTGQYAAALERIQAVVFCLSPGYMGSGQRFEKKYAALCAFPVLECEWALFDSGERSGE